MISRILFYVCLLGVMTLNPLTGCVHGGWHHGWHGGHGWHHHGGGGHRH